MKRVLPVLMNKSFQICNKAFLFKGFQNSSEKRDSKQSKNGTFNTRSISANKLDHLKKRGKKQKKTVLIILVTKFKRGIEIQENDL